MDKVKEWLTQTAYRDFELSIASCDASFRKYYRLKKESESYILMDSSLELNSLDSFLSVTSKLLDVNVHAPKIYEQNMQLGYLIIEDFGDINLLDVLNEESFKKLYLNAIDEIIKMQSANSEDLAPYDREFLHFEMDLMKEWYLEKKLNLQLNSTQIKILQNSLNAISDIVLSHKTNVFVHRDFHSRNIMIMNENRLGVIDYQDAMSGSVVYDLVSLLKDCYIKFDRTSIEKLALMFRDKKGLEIDDKEFIKLFDFMGLQRHIKVLGIFSRLDIRDGKNAYLKDIPLVLEYVLETAFRYKETKELAKFLKRVTT